MNTSCTPLGSLRMFRLMVPVVLTATMSVFASAQATPTGPATPSAAAYQGCIEKKSGYTCDLSGFRVTLAAAQTIAIKASPRDRIAQSQLKELIHSLGQSVAEEGTHADLTVQVVPADGNGVSIGPSGTDLATLRIYEGTPVTSGKLLWIETYNGQSDRPWPSIVHSVIAQFQSTLKNTAKR